MRVGHKLRKLFDPDIIASTREHLHRALHPVSARKLHIALEQDKSWDALRQKYPRGVKEVHRFGDTKFWIKRNVERAQDLSLDRDRSRDREGEGAVHDRVKDPALARRCV